MKYMLMIHQGTTPTPLDPEAWATLSADEQQAIYAAYKEVNETPGVTPGNGLQPPETASPGGFCLSVEAERFDIRRGPASFNPRLDARLFDRGRGRSDRPAVHPSDAHRRFRRR